MDVMGALRSERLAALLLVLAAVAGLVVANSPAAGAVLAARDLHLGPLSLGHWVTDGLLAVFFLLAAIELRHELTHGQLDSPRRALVPAVAAVGGVLVPALIFLALVRDPRLSGGWPIPTATDIAFALGVLALLGRGLPSRVRALLLALAVIDDLIAILLIAFFFTAGVQPVPLLIAAPLVLVFGWLGYRAKGPARIAVIVAMIILGLAVWLLVHLSGVHTTIAGVALGLALPSVAARPVRHALEPVSNGIILPLFAFTAALVAIPSLGGQGLSPVFWGIVIALPAGKLAGITGGALIASRLLPAAERRQALPLGDILVVAGLGGIGFTVSLLMNELAYRGDPGIAAQGTLAVLLGSLVAIVLGGALTAIRSRAARATSRP
ncbi:MAG: Na+/H+ antiporter NhaA [Schumannella sp.]|nr:Na+/H+ antiporter NhaA [Schumannella sp.]